MSPVLVWVFLRKWPIPVGNEGDSSTQSGIILGEQDTQHGCNLLEPRGHNLPPESPGVCSRCGFPTADTELHSSYFFWASELWSWSETCFNLRCSGGRGNISGGRGLAGWRWEIPTAAFPNPEQRTVSVPAHPGCVLQPGSGSSQLRTRTQSQSKQNPFP